ncbi:UDP-N-acetylmuramoyl-L-alanyl-D-glutamate--2,6-diaminopimelate ligase [Trinickia soli]|uniref:UDP-N-acetylmuramoyl-L-alanyl-D-glutamate--2,6-diaminopimelate ligase n=1 Tax=Trinickia soli TaxID=380675 RepID=A0A2N7W8S9_9BURK|nr:UDP-N-acetylmuramoyl-L-alanyl-D-glutamate--2,6-diaminopimelate ligase [Trinickia soli]KAA0081544.1 UDP-N-acetylmuramoyl-L-alanyl-D-glutamate--2,6-diaminopimelate ligase [Paraburkholderia sp. T12-10]PMS25816.1 UDP-N-acetylmuramoyl-L-alanyl-D-glutamate--2,6-diaminopimelate ligase [Trinickia soli]CAB3642133.1 UDP-N-acetylmuramoyl-L-alanyl-D-glutamate--2, 6-diaminopimelate ligase [Trinickia soli]
MSTPNFDERMQRQVADTLDWLRRHASPSALMHSDSRTLAAGDIFFAYAVEGADNRSYIAAALERGASAVLYQPEGFSGNVDPACSLAVAGLDQLAGEIASRWCGAPSESMRMIGVTGTNGKTSSSQWIAAALTALGEPCGVIGTLGSGVWGHLTHTGFTTPDAPQTQRSLAQLVAAGARACAMEVSSHALHQGRVNGTAFDIAVFTNLTQDHLDYHHTFEAYEAAKAKLFDWPTLKTAVINRDDAAGRRLIARTQPRLPTIAYGIGVASDAPSAHAALVATNVRATATGTAFHLSSDWGVADVEVGTLGEFNVSNLLGVLGALLAADVPLADAIAQLSKLEPVNGRMQRLGGRLANDEPLVVVDYAHTPDALEKTLEALRPIAQARGGQLICVFGCGGDRDATKRPLMGAIAERLADAVVVTSDNPRSEDPRSIIDQIVAGMGHPESARRLEDRANAILQTVRGAAREDVVLLAGKGHEATQEIMGKKRVFSDQDHARLALGARATHSRGGEQ